ncbi:MAG TPA: UPF0182 family protein [Actinomycetota bacterium]|nr:UPF0182 family protein [Actinomycetota bacterium]
MARLGDPLRRARRRLLLWLALAVAGVAVVFGAISGFYIDILWFREVDLSSVFWTRFWSRFLLAVMFGAAFFVLMYVNLVIVRRIRPRYRVFSPAEEAVERYRAAFEPYARWVIPGLALVFAAFAGAGVAGQWQQYQLWSVADTVSFGTTDPVFGRDVSFYVLSLPFQQFVQGWLFTSLVVITVVTGAAHYLWGGIRFQATGERVTAQVKVHLSVLIGLVVLVQAWGYRLGQFNLLFSPRGTVTGASYTDVNAQLPALRLLVVIAVICAVLFLINIRFRGWALPALGLGLLALASVVVGALYPAFIQRFRVAPQELQREQPFIARNIEFTRAAYGIEGVQERTFAAENAVTAEEVRASSQTVQNIRLWNPDVLKDSYLQLQRFRPYYEFPDVDVDRYVIDGQRRQVMISPREVTQNGIPGGGQTWQNQHLFYTHGFGATASRVDQVTTAGSPAFVLSNIPASGPLAETLQEPRIYFQERTDVPFVVVRTEAEEFDFPTGEAGGQSLTRYEGQGGIEFGGFLRRLAFAWRYRDVNLLISGLIGEDSRILINHDLVTRVQKLAPFLSYDNDPYAAIVDGRLVWIWDAYTTSDTYPYSERLELSTMIENETLPSRANYIRNSVKVVIDAYDGTTSFYLVDEADPVIEAWSKVFPDLFTPLAEASPELRGHFRYPEDLFRIQAHQYANYHIRDARQFYAKEDFWSVPQVARDPTAEASELEPYYVLLPLPGEEEERFVLFIPFTPADRPNMTAWLAADSDPERYGEMVTFEFGGRNVTGPGQAAALISQDTEVSQEVTLFGQLGSNVIYGDLLAIPIGESFLYVQPLYLESAGGGIPELKRVVVVNGETVEMADTLSDALTEIFEGEVAPPAPPGPGPGPEPPPGEPTADVAELLAQADQHFQAADEALRAGDLATYQEEINEARALIQRAAELAGVGAEPAPSPSPQG